MIKLVIFDLDGTVYDYKYCNEIAERKVYAYMADAFNMSEIDASNVYVRARTVTKAQTGNVASSHNRMLYMQHVCEIIGVNPIIYARKLYHIYWDSMLENMVINDNVYRAMNWLKQKKMKIAILSDLTAYIQFCKLEKLEIGNYIDCVVTSEEVGKEKPDLIMFETALSKCMCRASESIMVGDSYDRDIAGAIACGCKAILYRKDTDLVSEIEKICEGNFDENE